MLETGEMLKLASRTPQLSLRCAYLPVLGTLKQKLLKQGGNASFKLEIVTSQKQSPESCKSFLANFEAKIREEKVFL